MLFSNSSPQKYDIYIRNNKDPDYCGWFEKPNEYRTFLIFLETNKKVIFWSVIKNMEIRFDIGSICDQHFLEYYFKVK